MSKLFEEKVLKALDSLQKGQSSLEKGQSSLEKGQSSLEKGQSSLKNDVRRLEVLHEEMKEKIETVIEIGKAQKKLWEDAATKEDLHENEVFDKLTSLSVKSHSSKIADHERRLKRLEAKH